MSKSRSKQHKKGSATPVIPPASLLRPRLDALWTGATLPEHDQATMYANLDTITQGIRPAQFLPAMLLAYSAAPSDRQAPLDELLPTWLAERGYMPALEELVGRETLDSAQQQQALHWLGTAGYDLSTLTVLTPWDHFYRADYCGNPYQASLMLWWYTNRQQHRVQGYNFLIDYHPPWEGATKEVEVYPQRSPQAAVNDFIRPWKEHMPEPVRSLNALEAKQKILEALVSNRAANVRLPADLIPTRELFVRNVLTLPDGPATPVFTAENFDFLARNGEKPEALMHFEHTVGRRVRMENGKELLVMGVDQLLDEER